MIISVYFGGPRRAAACSSKKQPSRQGRRSAVPTLPQTPSQFSSPEMAVDGVAAHRKSADITPFGTCIVGIGAACALAS
jgi:hypothetical protein